MDEQNRRRLDRITKRHARRRAQGSSAAEAAASFLAAFARLRDEVLRPAMEDVARQLAAAGYEAEVANAGDGAPPGVALFVRIPDRGDSMDTIRLRAYEDLARGWQTIAEIELMGSPMEITRFDADEPVTREVIEQLLVDAIEQLFASTPSRARRAALAPVPASQAPVSEVAASATPQAPAVADEPSGVPAPAEGGPAPAPPAGDPLAVLLSSPGAPAPRAPSRRRAPPEKLAPVLPVDAPAAPAASVRDRVVERLAAGRRLHGLDLASADLHGLDLRGAPLAALDLRRANLRGAVLAGARLAAARLDGADLSDADLSGADLGRADLTGAILAGARLEGAVLTGTLGMPSSEPNASTDPARPEEPAPGSPTHPEEPAPEPSAAAAASALEQPTFLASRRSPLAATSLALDLPIGPALPFAKSVEHSATTTPSAAVSKGSPPAPARNVSPAPPLPRPATRFDPLAGASPAPSGIGTSTVAVSEDDAGVPLPPDIPDLTLEQYASLRVELQQGPDRAPQILVRYGVPADRREALDAHWKACFARDQVLHMNFARAYAEYVAWLKANSGVPRT